jgi:hypothetical protein
MKTERATAYKIYGWIGVDLDGTLAYYDGWVGIDHIGRPIPTMVRRVKTWLQQGRDVRIFTARVDNGPVAIQHITRWSIEHLGEALEITNVKDMHMVELWDDRAIQVERNTGRRIK